MTSAFSAQKPYRIYNKCMIRMFRHGGHGTFTAMRHGVLPLPFRPILPCRWVGYPLLSGNVGVAHSAEWILGGGRERHDQSRVLLDCDLIDFLAVTMRLVDMIQISLGDIKTSNHMSPHFRKNKQHPPSLCSSSLRMNDCRHSMLAHTNHFECAPFQLIF